MRLESIRITLRLHRFELVTLVLATLVTIAAAFLVASVLDGIDIAKACLPDANASVGPLCEKARQDFNDISYGQGSQVELLLNLLPVVAALILGASIVGREMERGTTRLAWSLTPARVPWYVARTLPILLVLIVASVLIGLAADRLVGARNPGMDVVNSFASNGARGLPIAGRAMASFALGVLGGAVLGKELPAFVLAFVAVIGMIVGVGRLDQQILTGEAIVQDTETPASGDLYIDSMFRMPDGHLASWQEAFPDGQAIDQSQMPPQVTIAVPAARYGFASARSAGEYAAIGLAGLVLAAGVATRRSPGT
ncbi:MAG TPA: hypothetical protein VK656_07890 [Candidatus Acidoferrum sp.]|nr:hypothetical protein [Candidatus Acidoferrum sp.]